MNRDNTPVFVLLSHDVDWGKGGAPISHILARKERFDESVLRNLDRANPYNNIPQMLELEDAYGLRSTFFFRTCVQNSRHPPPPYHPDEYKSEIRSMLSKGWEVGLHSDFLSHDNLQHLEAEKRELEAVTGTKILGNRVHYTLENVELFRNLKKLGFKYDSSVKYTRERISEKDFGYSLREGVIVFPITIMEALLFQYKTSYGISSETDVQKVVKKVLDTCEKMDKRRKIVTLIWHDSSLKMKFGRKYPDVLAYLASRRQVQVKRGIDLANMIENREI